MFVPPNVNSFGNMSQHKATFCSNFLRLATRLNTHFMRQYVLLHGINGAAGSTDVFVSKTLSEIGKFFRLKILMIFLSLSSGELGHVEELNKKVAQKSSVTIMSQNEKLSHNIFKNCWQRQRRRRKGGKMCFHFSYQKCWFMLHQQRKFFYEILNWKKFSFVYSSLMNFWKQIPSGNAGVRCFGKRQNEHSPGIGCPESRGDLLIKMNVYEIGKFSNHDAVRNFKLAGLSVTAWGKWVGNQSE